jgi:drug/metabolite transporter (DMT)-like permease
MKNKLPHINAAALTGYAAVITAAAFWGASGVFVKLIAGNETVPATALAFWRYLTTFICLLTAGLMAFPGSIRIRRSDWCLRAGMGANLGLFHIFYNVGIMLMSEIALAVFYAYLFLGERLTISQTAGAVLVVGGVLQLLQRRS